MATKERSPARHAELLLRRFLSDEQREWYDRYEHFIEGCQLHGRLYVFEKRGLVSRLRVDAFDKARLDTLRVRLRRRPGEVESDPQADNRRTAWSLVHGTVCAFVLYTEEDGWPVGIGVSDVRHPEARFELLLSMLLGLRNCHKGHKGPGSCYWMTDYGG